MIAPITSPLARLDDAATLRALVRDLGAAVYVATPAGELLDANAAFLALVACPSLEEARRLGMAHWVVEHDSGPVDPAYEGERREVDRWVVRPDGELRAVLDVSCVQRDAATGEAFVHGLLVDVTRHKTTEHALRALSWRDALTGCHNRRWLEDLSRNLATRQGAAWGCVYVDIDEFKQYNDRHGHQAGDEVLVRMARHLMRGVRAEEGVVRLGGDEFVIVLTGPDAAATETVAARLLREAAERAPAAFSLGWAVREGEEALETTLDRADQALMRVKVAARADRRGAG